MSEALVFPRRPEKTFPTLAALGHDLIRLTRGQCWFALARPFLYVAAYFCFAWLNWWLPAVLAVAGYTFYSYGSISHDLVHGNVGLPNRLNRVLLSMIELLGLRSGHAYRAAHRHHHRRFPHQDDVEGAAAHYSLMGSLMAGPRHQFRVVAWAVLHAPQDRRWILMEALLCVLMLGGSVVAWPVTPAPFIYVVLVVMGSWTFPLITAYLPHDVSGRDELNRTRRFRGRVAAFVFRDHLYHLEHHLYPKVPHQHWPALARRLDPYLDRAGVTAIRFGF